MPIVGAAIATAIFGAGAAGSFAFIATEALVNLALGVGLQLAGDLLTKQKQQTPGTNLQIQTGGVVPRSLLFGHSVTAGSLVYANVWGKVGDTPNAYLTIVVALADKRVGTPTNIWVDDTLCAWPDMSGTAPYAQGWPLSEFATGSNNRAWVRFHDGTQTTADSFLTDTFGSDANYPWESTAIGKGVAYAVLTFQYSRKYFSGSIPAVKIVTPGCYWYDPRKDSTVGGSGTQIWSDESTWAPTNNPAVHLYNILRGIDYNGAWLYGLQDMVAARLPLDSWFAAMNECDVAITQTDESTLPQYQAGGEVPVSIKPADAINALLTACAGRLSEVAGVYKLHVGAPGTAVMTFGDADIISTESQTYNPFPSISETINAITGKYPEPESAWASTDAPPLYNADYEAADGDRELPSDVSYDMVPYKEQVQRLMKSALAEARRFRQVTYVLPARARALEPGDFVSVTDTRNGFSSKLFRADDLKYLSSLDVQVTLTEVDPSDYDWIPDTDYRPVVPVPPTLVVPPPQEIAGWNAAPYTIVDNDGASRRPAILVSFGGDLDDVQSVRIQVRLAGGTALQFDGTTPYGDPSTNEATESRVVSFASILPQTDYEVRGVLVPYSTRAAVFSDWLAITTPDIGTGFGDLGPDLRALNSWIGEQTRALIEEMEAQALLVGEHVAQGYENVQTLRTELKSATDGITSAYTDAITVATGPASALAQRLTTLEADIPGLATASALDALTTRVSTAEGNITSNASAITALTTTVAGKADQTAVTALSSTVTAQGGQISAQNDAITALTTEVDGVTASGTFRIATGYTPSTGWTSRIGFQTSVDDGTPHDSGFFMESTSSAARIVMTADQVIMTDGTDVGSPFVFTDGVLYLNEAKIKSANIDDLSVTSAKIADLTIGTDKITAGAVTGKQSLSGSGTNTTTTNQYLCQTSAFANVQAAIISVSITLSVDFLSGSQGYVWGIQRTSDGGIIFTSTVSGSADFTDAYTIVPLDTAPNATSESWRIFYRCTTGFGGSVTATAQLGVIALKR